MITTATHRRLIIPARFLSCGLSPEELAVLLHLWEYMARIWNLGHEWRETSSGTIKVPMQVPGFSPFHHLGLRNLASEIGIHHSRIIPIAETLQSKGIVRIVGGPSRHHQWVEFPNGVA